MQKALRFPGADRYRKQLIAFKDDDTQTSLDLATTGDNRQRAQLHELVRSIIGLSSESRQESGGRGKTVVVTKESAA